MNSRSKGKKGELEFAAFLREHDVDARRGVQYTGGPDSPDIVHDLGAIHFEVKRTERLNVYEALHQAQRDAPAGAIPVVAHRRNREQWIVALSAHQLIRLIKRSAPHGG